MDNNSISVLFADSSHAHYAQRICDLIYESALQRGTGIAKRSPEYIAAKMTGVLKFKFQLSLNHRFFFQIPLPALNDQIGRASCRERV